MQTIPAINQEFIRNMESQRHQKRFTRWWFDQIRAVDSQTKKIGQLGIQEHQDRIDIQKQQARQHQEILQLIIKQQAEITKKLEALYKVIEQTLTAKQVAKTSTENQSEAKTVKTTPKR